MLCAITVVVLVGVAFIAAALALALCRMTAIVDAEQEQALRRMEEQ
jgi:hypothetical protein